MHSRIFGIVEKNFYAAHIDEYDWKLSGYYGEDVPHFADYVNEDTDIDKDFMWLIENFVNGKGIDTSLFDIDDKELTITFHKGFKEAYFRNAWEDLVKNVIGSSDAFEKFYNAGGFFTEEELYNLNFTRLYDEKFVLKEKPSECDLILSVEEVKAKIPE